MIKRKLFSEQTQEAREARFRTIFADCYRAIVGDNFEGPLTIVGCKNLAFNQLMYSVKGDFKGYECIMVLLDSADRNLGYIHFQWERWNGKKPEHGTYSFRIGADNRLETPIMY